MITQSTIDGKSYYTSVSRGVEYTVCPQNSGNFWVASRRLALGRSHFGGGKYYETINDIAKNCKAFVGLDILVSI
jgi:hypothetical protein